MPYNWRHKKLINAFWLIRIVYLTALWSYNMEFQHAKQLHYVYQYIKYKLQFISYQPSYFDY